jgi:hypothetical protein
VKVEADEFPAVMMAAHQQGELWCPGLEGRRASVGPGNRWLPFDPRKTPCEITSRDTLINPSRTFLLLYRGV